MRKLAEMKKFQQRNQLNMLSIDMWDRKWKKMLKT